jgi:uncharacterized protein
MVAGPDDTAERAAEAALHAAGMFGARVHAHGDVARVAVPAADVDRLAAEGRREAVVAAVRSAGFRFVSLDLADAADGD